MNERRSDLWQRKHAQSARRLWLYFTALGIDITSVIVPVAEAFIGKFTKEESA